MNTENYGSVYLVSCHTNGKVYVGQSVATQGIARRWSRHIGDAKYATNKYLHAAIRKHGVENFSIQEIATAKTKQSLDNLESIYIILFDSMNPEKGYNRRTGGSHGMHSDETKAILSEKRKGRVLTEEHKRRIGESGKGKKHHHSPEYLEKLRQRMLGNTHSLGTTHKWSEEAKLKFRRPKSETHRQNISEAAKIAQKNRVRNSKGQFS